MALTRLGKERREQFWASASRQSLFAQYPKKGDSWLPQRMGQGVEHDITRTTFLIHKHVFRNRLFACSSTVCLMNTLAKPILGEARRFDLSQRNFHDL